MTLPQRLAKSIAASGLCSRRDAELLIKKGLVEVDGKKINSPAFNVNEKNKISVSGKEIEPISDTRIWIYNKPAGIITTHKDRFGRITLFSTLEGLPRVISVGRLDLNSEGLILLTNDGAFARKLELPSSGLERIYRVRAYGDPSSILKASFPVIIENFSYNPKSIKLIKGDKKNAWYEVILTEGKNREIRKIFSRFGLKVSRLIRTSYGDFKLGNLKPGEYREVKKF